MNRPLFCKDPLEIIAEASRTDNIESVDEELASDMIGSVAEAYENFERIPVTKLKFDVRDVPITESESSSGATRYLVDNDILLKFMESNEIDTVKEGLESICEADKINMADMYLVVEGQGDMINTMHKYADELTKPKKGMYSKLKVGYQYFQDIINTGIKVLQKEDKYIPQQDSEGFMATNKPSYSLKYSSEPSLNDDMKTQNMKSSGAHTNQKFPNSSFNNDDMKTQNMNGSAGKIKYGDDPFPYDDDRNPMPGNAGKIKNDSTPFPRDENRNGMKGYSGQVAKPNHPFVNDDPSTTGMLSSHKGY